MTVRELIEKLRAFDPELPAVINHTDVDWCWESYEVAKGLEDVDGYFIRDEDLEDGDEGTPCVAVYGG